MHESDEEETLSLCDLPLYSNSITDQTSEWEQFSASTSTSISSSSQDDDYFEFSSQEFTPSAAADFPPENIIFCGKLIPYKQPHNNNQPILIQKANNNSNSPDLLIIESRKNRIEMWKNSSTSNAARGTTLTQSPPPPPKKTYNTNKQINLSLFTSSSSSGKTKWYFLFFGSPRFSTEVDLRDFKSRRRSLRRQFSSPPPMFRFENQEEDEDEYDDGDGDFVGGGRNRRLGLWGMLIKVLSCGGGNHQSAAASIGCSTPRMTET
ncbi:hypothetical protein ABFS82_06G168800 [Erythranthe guttata]